MRFIHKCQSGFSVKVLFLVREQEHNRAMGTWDTSELSCGTIPGASRRRSEAEGLAELQPSGVGGGHSPGLHSQGRRSGDPRPRGAHVTQLQPSLCAVQQAGSSASLCLWEIIH